MREEIGRGFLDALHSGVPPLRDYPSARLTYSLAFRSAGDECRRALISVCRLGLFDAIVWLHPELMNAKSERIRRDVLAGHPFGPGRLRERWHLGARGGSLRASVFGVSDGLVSNLALILGVAGGGVSARVVVLAGV